MSHVVRYRAAEEHLTETVKGKDGDGKDIVQVGSVHHAEHQEFTGLITHSVISDDGSELHDIVIFLPGKPAPVHLQGIAEGDGPGTLTLVSTHPSKKR